MLIIVSIFVLTTLYKSIFSAGVSKDTIKEYRSLLLYCFKLVRVFHHPPPHHALLSPLFAGLAGLFTHEGRQVAERCDQRTVKIRFQHRRSCAALQYDEPFFQLAASGHASAVCLFRQLHCCVCHGAHCGLEVLQTGWRGAIGICAGGHLFQ